MTDGPIKAALRAARDAAEAIWPIDVRFPDECDRDDAEVARCDAFVAAIEAFLRALPHGSRVPEADDPEAPGWSWEHWIGRDLAAAVRRAAQEGGR